jgi:hypothetical protein
VAVIAVAFAVSAALSGGSHELEATASRHVRLFDAALVAASAALMLAGCGLTYLDQPPATWRWPPGATRSDLGLALLGRGIVGSQVSTLFPTAYLLLTSLIRPGNPVWAGLWGWSLPPPTICSRGPQPWAFW